MSERTIEVQQIEAKFAGEDMIPVHVIATERPENMTPPLSAEEADAHRQDSEALVEMADWDMPQDEKEAFDTLVAEHKAKGAAHAGALAIRNAGTLRANDAITARSVYGHDHK